MVIQQDIEQRLRDGLAPQVLEVLNESHMHNVPPGSESHFKVTLVTDAFLGKRKVARHQAVYAQLADLLAGPVHALALHTYTPEEWSTVEAAPDSPNCHGGEKA